MRYLVILLFLSGCTGMDYMSGFNSFSNIKNYVETHQPEVPAKVVSEDALAEEEFYDSNYNWNGVSKTTKVESKNLSPEVQKPPKRKEKVKEQESTSIPLPLILIALLSGVMYIINRVRYYRLRKIK